MGMIETCNEKQRHRSKSVAKSKIHSNNKKWLEVYKCRVCGYWHLAHKKYSPKIPCESNYNDYLTFE
jgi:rubrerythrin